MTSHAERKISAVGDSLEGEARGCAAGVEIVAGSLELSIDRTLKLLQSLGLVMFLGGLAALSAMWLWGPRPGDLAQWRLLIGHTRAVFYPCVFAGIIVLALTGMALWWRHRRVLHGRRWFKIMMWSLAVTIPLFHLWARSRALKLYSAVEQQQLNEAATHWNELGLAYVVSLMVMTLIAAVGFTKPRLGQGSEFRMEG